MGIRLKGIYIAMLIAIFAFYHVLKVGTNFNLQNIISTNIFGNAIKPKDYNSVSGGYLAGFYSASKDKYNTAANYFYKSGIKKTDDPALLEESINLFLISGQFDKAFKLAHQIIEVNPESSIANFILAIEDINFANYEDAQERLKHFGGTSYDNNLYQLIRAWIKYGQGEYSAAKAILDGMSYHRRMGLLSMWHTALIADLSDNSYEAELIYKEFSKDVRNIPYSLIQTIVDFYYRQGKGHIADKLLRDYEQQVDTTNIEDKLYYRPVTNTQEGIAHILFGASSIILDDDNNDKSISLLRLAQYLDPNHDEIKFLNSLLLQKIGNYKESIELLSTINLGSKLYPRAIENMATIFRRMGDYKRSEEILKRMISNDINALDAYINLGDLYKSPYSRQYDKAAQAYTNALEIFDSKKRRNNYKWSILFSRGISYERLDKWPQAEADFKEALSMAPNHPDILNYLAYSWVDKGINLEEAKKMLLIAHSLRPISPHITDSLGWVYHKLGDNKKAALLLEKAASMLPYDSMINFHLAIVYKNSGRLMEAKYLLQRAYDNTNKDALKQQISLHLQKLQLDIE